ncbi:MAG: apolipoprotein N-acyltransferase [Nitrospinota bacterium]
MITPAPASAAAVARKKAPPRKDFPRGLRLTHRVTAAALSGVLFVFCFPTFDWAALSWVALIPMLAAVEGLSPRRAFWLGGLTGMVGYVGVLYWVTITMTRYGNLPVVVAWLVLLMLAAYLSLYPAAFCALLCRFGRESGPLRFALAPFLWTSLELLRTHFLTGFPWAALGYTQYATLPVIQVADVTGVYGVGFLIVLANAALWGVLRGFLPGSPRKGRWGAGWVLGGAALLIGAVLLYGRGRLQTFGPPSQGPSFPDGALKVALLQGNIDQELKWDKEYQLKTLKIYRDLTYKFAGEKPDLIVWPETAAPFFFLREKELRETLLDLAAEVKTPLLVGAPSVVARDREYRLRNSAFLVTPEKKVEGEYHKMHLVPYGEYIPLKRWFPFIRKMVTGIGDFLPGVQRTVFPHAKAPFSVLICYEVIFPDEVRRFVRGGARMLVNVTNDAWFGRSAAPYQHLAMAALRAVENRAPLVRAANTGVTAVVDASGRIRRATDLFVRTGVVTSVLPARPAALSFYTRFGDLFAYLCAAVTFLVFAFAWRGPREGVRMDESF